MNTAMLQSILLAIVLFISPTTLTKPADKPAPAPAPATQPAPAQNQSTATAGEAEAESDETLYGVFGRTRVGQLVEGKKKVTLADMRDPAFWTDTIKELAVVLLAFIPRLFVAGSFIIFFWLLY